MFPSTRDKMLVRIVLLLIAAALSHGKSLSARAGRSYDYSQGVGQPYQSYYGQQTGGNYYYPQVDGQPIYVPSIAHSASDMKDYLDDYYYRDIAYTKAWNRATPAPYNYDKIESNYYENPVTANSIVKNFLEEGHLGGYHALPKSETEYNYNPEKKNGEDGPLKPGKDVVPVENYIPDEMVELTKKKPKPVPIKKTGDKKPVLQPELESADQYETPVVQKVKKSGHKKPISQPELESVDEYESPVVHDRVKTKKTGDKKPVLNPELESADQYETPVKVKKSGHKKPISQPELESVDEYESPIVHDRVKTKKPAVQKPIPEMQYEDEYESPAVIDRVKIKKPGDKKPIPEMEYTDDQHELPVVHDRIKIKDGKTEAKLDYADVEYEPPSSKKEEKIEVKEDKKVKQAGKKSKGKQNKDKVVIKTKGEKTKEKIVIKSEDEYPDEIKEKDVVKSETPGKTKDKIVIKEKNDKSKEKVVVKTKGDKPKEKVVIKSEDEYPVEIKEKDEVKSQVPSKTKEKVVVKVKNDKNKEKVVIKTKGDKTKDKVVIKKKGDEAKEKVVIKTKDEKAPVKIKEKVEVKSKPSDEYDPHLDAVMGKSDADASGNIENLEEESEQSTVSELAERNVDFGDESEDTLEFNESSPNEPLNAEEDEEESDSDDNESSTSLIGENKMNVPKLFPNLENLNSISSLNSNIWSLLFNPNAERNKPKKCVTRNNETGHCSYVQHCEVPDIVTSLEGLLNNACVMDDVFIGVCCPEFPVQTVKVHWENEASNTDKLTEVEVRHNSEDCGIRSNEASEAKSWPWKAPLLSMSNGKIFCGGVLISEDYVLTAAHCTTKIPRNQILVRVGQHNDSSGDDFAVIEIKRHAQYNPRTMNNDIALLKLGRRIVHDEYTGVICLPEEDEDDDEHDGEKAVLLGWKGMFGKNSKRTEFLEVMKNKECGDKLRLNVPKTVLCTEARNEDERTCNADSGAPLVIEDDDKYEVIGILGWNRNDCDQRFPSTFSKVSKYVGWIKKHAV